MRRSSCLPCLTSPWWNSPAVRVALLSVREVFWVRQAACSCCRPPAACPTLIVGLVQWLVARLSLRVSMANAAACAAGVAVHRGSRPAPPEGSPDLPLAFQMLNDNLQLYRDVGGGSLHRCVCEGVNPGANQPICQVVSLPCCCGQTLGSDEDEQACWCSSSQLEGQACLFPRSRLHAPQSCVELS